MDPSGEEEKKVAPDEAKESIDSNSSINQGNTSDLMLPSDSMETSTSAGGDPASTTDISSADISSVCDPSADVPPVDVSVSDEMSNKEHPVDSADNSKIKESDTSSVMEVSNTDDPLKSESKPDGDQSVDNIDEVKGVGKPDDHDAGKSSISYLDSTEAHKNGPKKEIIQAKIIPEEDGTIKPEPTKDNLAASELPKADLLDSSIAQSDVLDQKDTDPQVKGEQGGGDNVSEVQKDVDENPQASPKPSTSNMIASGKELILDKINSIEHVLKTMSPDDQRVQESLLLLSGLRELVNEHLDVAKDQKVKGKRGYHKNVSSGPPKKKEKLSTDVQGLSNVDLSEIDGLAVYAKWPHSGWFYPGKVRNLMLENWNESNKVTVFFYDGLERDMKSIHIMPAALIPAGSIMFDLDEEIDVTVCKVKSSENWVEYNVKLLEDSPKHEDGLDGDTKSFDKLAIKAASMKSIRGIVVTETVAENVSSRRSRGKPLSFAEDYVASSRRGPRSSDTDLTDLSDASPSTSSRSLRRSGGQVNGNPKTTPRRKSSGGRGK